MKARTFLAAAFAALLAACGSSSTSSGTTAKMTVRLVDAPATDYKAVTLYVKSVEIASDSGWVTLGTVNESVNLLDLQNGAFKTLALDAELPPGHYGQMRLQLGAPNTVTLMDDSIHELTVPSGAQTGVKMPVSFDLQAGTTYEIFIDMNANKSVFVHQAGASGKYMLRPVVHAYDKMMTGSITGVLTDAAGKGLGGVEVFAQTVGAGGATYANSAVTQSSGAYAIGLLPVDRTYHVACQPVTYGDTTTSYGPKASPGIAINSTTPVVTWNASFTAVAETGSVAGSVTSASTPPIDLTGTMVQARFPFDLGGTLGTVPLIVRDTPGTPSPVTYAFDFLPVSSLYTMVAELPADPTAGTPARFSPPAPATVTTGATATVDLTIP